MNLGQAKYSFVYTIGKIWNTKKQKDTAVFVELLPELKRFSLWSLKLGAFIVGSSA